MLDLYNFTCTLVKLLPLDAQLFFTLNLDKPEVLNIFSVLLPSKPYTRSFLPHHQTQK